MIRFLTFFLLLACLFCPCIASAQDVVVVTQDGTEAIIPDAGDLLLKLLDAALAKYPTLQAVVYAVLALLTHQAFAVLVRALVRLTPSPADDSWAEMILGWLKALALIQPGK